MAAILIDWIYTFFICIGTGIWIYPFVSQRDSLFFLLLTGLFVEMILVWLVAFFFPIGEIFYLMNSLFAFAGLFVFRKRIRELVSAVKENFNVWKKGIKLLVVLLFFLILMQSSTATLIVDNDSYYTATVSWLNHFGMVPGLINLHPFLGQVSGWHILQSGVNFGFVSDSLNALNGFLLLAITLFSLSRLNAYFQEDRIEDLFMGLLPVANIFLFQFISAPSPDLPVFLLSQLIFYLFYIDFQKGEDHFRLILITVLFLILIKATVFPLLILPFILWLKRKKHTAFLFGLSAGCFALFVSKNYIITGFPLYPSHLFSNLLSSDWQFPEEVYRFMTAQSRFVGMDELETTVPQNTSEWFFLKHWLFGGIRSLMNWGILLVLAIFPFFIKRNKALWILYAYAVIQFLLLYSILPQYRFFFPLILGTGLFLLAGIFRKWNVGLIPTLTIVACLPLLTLLIPIPINSLANSDQMSAATPVFKSEFLLNPHPNSKIKSYSKQQEGNLNYFSPEGDDVFFWSTGDAKGASINKEMVDYFKHYYGFRAQLRGAELKEGFYAERRKK